MKKEMLTSAMKASISDVLETMFFLPLELSDDVPFEKWWSSCRKDLLVAKLCFNGPVSGTFFFFIPKDLGLSLAANFMGEEEGAVSQEQVEDTVKELLNMISGNSFGIWDDQQVFDLGIPEIVNFEEAEKDNSACSENVFIGIMTLDDNLGLELIMQP